MMMMGEGGSGSAEVRLVKAEWRRELIVDGSQLIRSSALLLINYLNGCRGFAQRLAGSVHCYRDELAS